MRKAIVAISDLHIGSHSGLCPTSGYALDEVETAKLSAGVYYYDVQIVRSAGTVSTLTSGEFTVSADVTRATT